MTWSDLIGTCAAEHTLTVKTTRSIAARLFELIANDCAAGGRVDVPGFGVFMVRERKGRRVRNPQTGQLMWLPTMRSLGFKASKHKRQSL